MATANCAIIHSHLLFNLGTEAEITLLAVQGWPWLAT